MHNVHRLDSETHIGNDSAISVKTHRLTEDFPLHWHNYFEIEIVLGGRGIMTVNGEDFDTDTYRVFLLTPIDFHQIHPQKELQLINISFDAKMLSDRGFLRLSAPLSKAYHLQEDAMQRLLQAVSLLENEYRIEGCCQNQLCEYILECLFRENPPAALPENGENLTGIKKAILYLEMHFKEDISLTTLARQAGFNTAYFSELFRKTTGQSYKQRIIQLRLEYAKMLLSYGFSVSRACFESGFGSVSNFNAAFKQRYHTTPRQYRLR